MCVRVICEMKNLRRRECVYVRGEDGFARCFTARVSHSLFMPDEAGPGKGYGIYRCNLIVVRFLVRSNLRSVARACFYDLLRVVFAEIC